MKDEIHDCDDNYHAVGWYHIIEAKHLLRDLEKEAIDFYIEAPHADPAKGNVVAAAYGGFVTIQVV